MSRNTLNPISFSLVAWKRFPVLLIMALFSGGLLQAQTDDPDMEEADTTITRTTIEVAPVETLDEEEESTAHFIPLRDMDSVSLYRRKVPDSVINALQEDDDFWYANANIEKKKPEKEKRRRNLQPDWGFSWMSTILWVVIVGVFLAVVIYYMAESGLFRRKRRVVTDNRKDPSLEEMPEDIFAIRYQQEIDKAVAGGDYRLAVRLQYLRLLKHMAEKNRIRYQQDKTNMDYLLQLYNTEYYHDFFRITRHYEYSWYGRFAVSPDAYRLISQDMEQFQNKR